MTRTPTVARALMILALLAGLAGCDAIAPTPTPTPAETLAPTGDGVLRLGTLTDASSAVGAAQVAGVEVAVREINEAGGVGGVPIEVLHRGSGSDPASSIAAVEALGSRGVDVVIGPVSGQLADAIAPVATRSGAVLFALDTVQPELRDDAFRARLLQSDPGLLSFDGAALAYDATILAALAAVAAQDDAGTSVAWGMRSSSDSGIQCRSYGECREALAAGLAFSYLGYSGPVQFASDGSRQGVYRVGVNGHPEPNGTSSGG